MLSLIDDIDSFLFYLLALLLINFLSPFLDIYSVLRVVTEFLAVIYDGTSKESLLEEFRSSYPD